MSASGSHRGFPVVLTGDGTLFAGYSALFEGMVAASQTSRTPALLMKHLLAPAIRPISRQAAQHDGLRARQAPLGLRRVEYAPAAGLTINLACFKLDLLQVPIDLNPKT